VKNAENFDNVLVDAVHSQKRKSRKHQFAGIRLVAWTAAEWKLWQRGDTFVETVADSARGGRAVMLLGVVANVREVVDRWPSPANPH
jgi:hypothetical protein